MVLIGLGVGYFLRKNIAEGKLNQAEQEAERIVANGERMGNYINKVKGKESITVFGMNPPAYEGDYSFEMLGFPILQSLGIRAEEL